MLLVRRDENLDATVLVLEQQTVLACLFLGTEPQCNWNAFKGAEAQHDDQNFYLKQSSSKTMHRAPTATTDINTDL